MEREMVEEDIYEPSEAEQLRWAIGVLEKRHSQSAMMARGMARVWTDRDKSVRAHHQINEKATEIALKHLAAASVTSYIAQSLARGSVAPEELDAMREHAPSLIQAMKAITGMTVSQLRHAAAAHTLRITIEEKA